MIFFFKQVRHKSNRKVYAMKLLSKFEMVRFPLNKIVFLNYIIHIF